MFRYCCFWGGLFLRDDFVICSFYKQLYFFTQEAKLHASDSEVLSFLLLFSVMGVFVCWYGHPLVSSPPVDLVTA